MKKYLVNPMSLVGMIFAPIGFVFLIVALIVGINMESIVNSANTNGDVRILPFIFGGLGLLFMVIGTVMVVLAIKKVKESENIIENGYYVDAIITGVHQNHAVTINGRHPLYVECQYEDSETGAIHLFTSDNLWNCPKDIVGCEIRVFVDSNDFGNYHVYTEVLEDMVIRH